MSFLSKNKQAEETKSQTATDFAAIEKETFVFEEFPTTIEALKARPEAALTDPFATAALTVAALCVYAEDRDTGIEMLNFLKGPTKLSVFDQQFLKDRFADKDYVPASYFDGTSPDNDYTPSEPYSITVYSSKYSVAGEGYITLFVKSSGADTQRQIVLRNKPSSGQWFVWNYGGILSDIRTPVKDNPWA